MLGWDREGGDEICKPALGVEQKLKDRSVKALAPARGTQAKPEEGLVGMG